jgi:hypothetical protein
MESELTEKEVVFVSKVSAAESRKNGKEYNTPSRTTVPTDKARESGLKEGDYLLIRASKVKRFHLLDWDGNEGRL